MTKHPAHTDGAAPALTPAEAHLLVQFRRIDADGRRVLACVLDSLDAATATVRPTLRLIQGGAQ